MTRESMMELPIRRYEGEVRLVATPAETELALSDILADEVAGFDRATRPR
jgi:hypothetical protein